MEKFLKRRIQHQLLFGWMSAVKHFMPSASLETSAKGFHKRYGLDMKHAAIMSSMKEFERMCKEENELNKIQHGRETTENDSTGVTDSES